MTYRAKDWVESTIESKKALITGYHKDIERTQAKIVEARKEIAELEEDLAKLKA